MGRRWKLLLEALLLKLSSLLLRPLRPLMAPGETSIIAVAAQRLYTEPRRGDMPLRKLFPRERPEGPVGLWPHLDREAGLGWQIESFELDRDWFPLE